jgi:hypothetical protein
VVLALPVHQVLVTMDGQVTGSRAFDRGGGMGVTGTSGGRRGETARAFVGRASEIQNLVAAADDAERGCPPLMVIVGPAGIGKSALVASALDRLPQFRPIMIRADESESLLDYSVLGQLTGALSRRQVASLPLLSAGPPRESARASVGAELVRVLGDLDLGGPLALVVEDAHWLDIASSAFVSISALSSAECGTSATSSPRFARNDSCVPREVLRLYARIAAALADQ